MLFQWNTVVRLSQRTINTVSVSNPPTEVYRTCTYNSGLVLHTCAFHFGFLFKVAWL